MQKVHAPKERPSTAVEDAVRVLDGIDRDESGALLVQPKLRVGAADDAYEREADAVAEQVVAGLAAPRTGRDDGGRVRRSTDGAGTIGAAGGPVSADVEQSIERSRGRGRPLPDSVRPTLERSMGADLGSVRVHTDENADVLNRSMQANAFTTGNDIFFRSGQFDPGSAAGVRLIAHEAAHVAQQGGVRRTIRRDLAPATALTFEALAEKAGDGKKVTIRSPRYVKVKTALRNYMAKSGTKDTKWRAKELKTILDLIEAWLSDKKNAAGSGDVADARREAFNWLAPKIAAEFVTVDSLTANSKGGVTGESARGNMSEVELGVKTKKQIGTSKSNTGVFKATSNTYSGGDAPAALDSGIDRKNAKFTERAVAGTAISKLMGSQVVAESIKADRDGKSGYMMEQVSGVQPKGERKIRPSNDIETRDWTFQAKTSPDLYGMDEKGPFKREEVVNVVNWKDPDLQEQLVELQLFDAITGQVDRHQGNYFVDQKPGQKTKVKGIDPDLSFGKDKGLTKVLQPLGGSSDKSMDELPPIVSKSTFDRIMAMTDSDVKALLGPLLSPAEVDQAVTRLQLVKAHLQGLQNSGLVFNSFKDEDENFRTNRFTEKNSYIGRDMFWQARTLFTKSGKVANF